MMHVTGTSTHKGGGTYKWTTVHLWSPAVNALLCNRRTTNAVTYVTDAPVTCKECWRAIQMVARDQLSNLSSAGVEKILDYIAQMRNGDIKDANESLG